MLTQAKLIVGQHEYAAQLLAYWKVCKDTFKDNYNLTG